ncbi:recombinase family protein [Citricoccus sp. I39-566]|uniref:recombinase family protein n=1 Tax=Citricoccus sp. I39-566 TaxID=3073268 RepID=UPI002869F6E2|nr:recombinase family protein [Citricoccus sp. I39-566]WMY79705.1 recombinase family protein [Citricoccus sp. I39-566]
MRRLLDLIDHQEFQGAHFRSLTEGIATTGPMGKAMLTVKSAFARLERDQLAERTKTGMPAMGGRPAVMPEALGRGRCGVIGV